MAGEDAFTGQIGGILQTIIPVLQFLFLILIVALIWFFVWKRKGSRVKKPVTVLVKRKRGEDFAPEILKGGITKNNEGQQIYKLSNGDEVPAAMFHDLKNFGKKGTFVELLEKERGQYVPAESPFMNTLDKKPDFTQADVNWLVDQHKNNIRMFEKKSMLDKWLPIIIPAVTIFVVVLALILFITNGLMPLVQSSQGIAQSNQLFAERWDNITARWENMSSTNSPITVVAGK
jgi:hypothetical protein